MYRVSWREFLSEALYVFPYVRKIASFESSFVSRSLDNMTWVDLIFKYQARRYRERLLSPWCFILSRFWFNLHSPFGPVGETEISSMRVHIDRFIKYTVRLFLSSNVTSRAVTWTRGSACKILTKCILVTGPIAKKPKAWESDSRSLGNGACWQKLKLSPNLWLYQFINVPLFRKRVVIVDGSLLSYNLNS